MARSRTLVAFLLFLCGGSLGLWQLSRAHPGRESIFDSARSSSRAVFEGDLGGVVRWIEAERGPSVIACGPGAISSRTYPHGGVVGFADGNVIDLHSMVVVSDGKGVIRVRDGSIASPMR